ncbi:hypothetical protein [Leucobacter sp. wl10]|uniref:hypothetical protein n=1 Tax=Leucobacter sp. wl10 TaxID=2304677 RepID=UPI0013C3696A|nr:hypothetical protein [Leucobacter sp. wl10]
MSMDTTITVNHVPVDQEEAARIARWLDELAERYEFFQPEIGVECRNEQFLGHVFLANYDHKYQIDGLDTLARVLSRLLPGCDVDVEEEGFHDGHWAERATYRSGRKLRSSSKQWVDTDVNED